MAIKTLIGAGANCGGAPTQARETPARQGNRRLPKQRSLTILSTFAAMSREAAMPADEERLLALEERVALLEDVVVRLNQWFDTIRHIAEHTAAMGEDAKDEPGEGHDDAG